MEFEYISSQFYAFHFYKRDFLRFICVQLDSSPSIRVDFIQSLSIFPFNFIMWVIISLRTKSFSALYMRTLYCLPASFEACTFPNGIPLTLGSTYSTAISFTSGEKSSS